MAEPLPSRDGGVTIAAVDEPGARDEHGAGAGEEVEPDAAGSQGEVPEGVGPEVFREQLRQAADQDPADGAHIRLDRDTVFLEDIETVEEESGGHHSRVRLRNGVIIGGLTGAAIVAALASMRYRRRHS